MPFDNNNAGGRSPVFDDAYDEDGYDDSCSEVTAAAASSSGAASSAAAAASSSSAAPSAAAAASSSGAAPSAAAAASAAQPGQRQAAVIPSSFWAPNDFEDSEGGSVNSTLDSFLLGNKPYVGENNTAPTRPINADYDVMASPGLLLHPYDPLNPLHQGCNVLAESGVTQRGSGQQGLGDSMASQPTFFAPLNASLGSTGSAARASTVDPTQFIAPSRTLGSSH